MVNMSNTQVVLIELLQNHSKLTSNSGSLLKNLTQELARKNDPELIELLLSDERTKQEFFIR